MHISVPTLAAAVMLAALSFDAHADTSSQPVKITGTSAVYYGDLNLTLPQDAKTMLERIELAATKACGGHPTFSSTTGRLDSTFQDCRNEAVARTVEQLGAQLVTRIYSEARLREG
jgi:UrcA family protein